MAAIFQYPDCEPIERNHNFELRGDSMIKTRLDFFAVVLCLATFSAPSVSYGELLFEDDFSTGDFSKHNDHFRWGRSGAIPAPGDGATVIVDGMDRNGQPSKMMRFQYGTWQEVRFHLTESLNEVRTETGRSNVAHREIWIRYSMRVPDNYFHRQLYRADGSEIPSNNKGFLYLWNGNYEKNPTGPDDGMSIGFSVGWWPASDPSEYGPNSYQTYVWNKGEPTLTSYWHRSQPTFIAQSMRSQSMEYQSFGITKADRGRWVDYAFGVRTSDPNASNGFFEMYKDGVKVIAYDDIDNFSTLPGRNGYDRGYLLGYHNSSYSETTTFYIAKFRIGTSAESVGIKSQQSSTRPQAPILTVR